MEHPYLSEPLVVNARAPVTLLLVYLQESLFNLDQRE
jgi:hypothetical protein